MKPHRVRMTHDLLQGYGLLDLVELMLPPHPTVKALTRFHADDYIAFLRSTADGSSLSSSIHSGGGGGGPSSPIQEAPHGVFSPAAYNNAGYAANKQQQATAAQLHGLPVTAATASHSNSRSLSPSSVGGSTAASVDPTDTGGGPQGAPPFVDQISRFNIGEDCPVFDGLWEYCKTYTGGSIEGARRVVQGEYQFAINWAGGLHHGKKHEASGFCYVNDCVLAALEFLRYKHRVLYVDVDIHHGDGVEEAFYTSPRVLCCSFHKYGHFFPGTGALEDIGMEEGLGYSVNVPLHEGIDDQMYSSLFVRVMDQIMDIYRPEAVVLQCGADSVAGDRLGCFNLSLDGHSEAVRYFCKAGVPAIFLGGGGYTLGNVPRCWAKETGYILGVDLDPKIPDSCMYRGYYGPNYELKIRTTNMENRNEEKYIDSIVQKISTTLREHVYPIGGQISANFTDTEKDTGVVLQSSLEESDDKNGDGEEAAQHFCVINNRDRA
ncbi:histone deacetylase, putative [Eimeria acervulina]|uniref:Histone deacetylase n=1 Tax=Eimeria acervulina TaxID=5801 RepID=U6GBQ7_EIMAC|nr:histone deacetylase, putative [Eimeria acervulina]CDI77701.1 histone deacetylase, putative [Eimeria acervulina]